MHLQDQPVMKPAIVFESDTHLIDAVTIHLGRYAASLKEQLPDCTNHQVGFTAYANYLGEPKHSPDFSAYATFEGTRFCGTGEEPEEAIFDCVAKAKNRGARVRHVTKFERGLSRLSADIQHLNESWRCDCGNLQICGNVCLACLHVKPENAEVSL